MWQQSQIDFQLKLKTLQGSVQSKILEIQSISLLIKNIDSAKIQSEDEIIELVAKIHGSVGNLSKIILDIKDFCYELGLNSFYDLFKQIFAIMGASIKLLAQSCQSGVQRSLIKFKSQRRKQAAQTQCSDLKNECKTQALYHTSVVRRMNQTEQLSNIQINKIYENIEEQKQAILRIAPSNAAMKINQVEIGWMRILNDYNEILEEVSRESGREQFGQKIYKPEYLSKVLKQELWQSLKTYFKDFVFKTVQRFHTQFYTHQYSKLKEQIQNNKPQTKNVLSQTDIEGFKQIKQINKDRKTLQKISKELKQVIGEKNDLNQQFNKVTKANEALNTKIQEIQKRLSKNNLPNTNYRLSTIQKKIPIDTQKIDPQRDSFFNLKTNLSRFKQKLIGEQQSIEKQSNDANLIEEQDRSNKKQQKIENNAEDNFMQEILKKKRNLKIVYSKGKNFRQNNQITSRINTEKCGVVNDDTYVNNKNNKSQRSITYSKVFDAKSHQNQTGRYDSLKVNLQQKVQSLSNRKSHQESQQKNMARGSYKFFVKQLLKNGFNYTQRDLQKILQPKSKSDEVNSEDKRKNSITQIEAQSQNSHKQNKNLDFNRISIHEDKKVLEPQMRKKAFKRGSMKKIPNRLQNKKQRVFITKKKEQAQKLQNDENSCNTMKKQSYTPRKFQRFDRLNIQQHRNQSNQKLMKQSIQNTYKGKQKSQQTIKSSNRENNSEVIQNQHQRMLKIQKLFPQIKRVEYEIANNITQICKKFNFEEDQIKNLISNYIVQALSQEKKGQLPCKQEAVVKYKYRASKMETF